MRIQGVDRKDKNIWFKWSLVIVWCALIFYATASPYFTGDNTAKIINELVSKDQLIELKTTIDEDSSRFSINKLVRKTAHLSVFGMLALLIRYALSKSRYQYLIAWSLATLYGVFDEFHQSLTPGRTASINDVGYDSLGALIALTLYWLYLRGGNRKIN